MLVARDMVEKWKEVVEKQLVAIGQLLKNFAVVQQGRERQVLKKG